MPVRPSKLRKKRVLKKAKKKRPAKVVCVACGDTGRNSRGGVCIPCARKGRV